MLDLRLAFRNLLARPSFSAVALLTLALGIGANTAVFTVFNAVLLSPLPYAEPQQIVILNETSPQLPNASVTRYNYDDWRTRAQSFSAMGAFRPTSMTITGSGEPERVPAKMISANLLPLLGVTIDAGPGIFRERRRRRRRRRGDPERGAGRSGNFRPRRRSGNRSFSTTAPTPSSA